MKASSAALLQPRRRRNIYHLALCAAALLLLSACEKTPEVGGTGTTEPVVIRVVNNCDKNATFRVGDDKGTYLSEIVAPHSKGGPWKLVDVYNQAIQRDYFDVDITIHKNLFDSVQPTPTYFERIHFDPVPQHIFTINVDYTVDYTLMTISH